MLRSLTLVYKYYWNLEKLKENHDGRLSRLRHGLRRRVTAAIVIVMTVLHVAIFVAIDETDSETDPCVLPNFPYLAASASLYMAILTSISLFLLRSRDVFGIRLEMVRAGHPLLPRGLTRAPSSLSAPLCVLRRWHFTLWRA